MGRRKSKNKNILIISITSFLLLLSVLGAIIYKNQMGQPTEKVSDETKQEQLDSNEDKEVNLLDESQSEETDSNTGSDSGNSNSQNNNNSNNNSSSSNSDGKDNSSETNTSNEVNPSTGGQNNSTSNSGSPNNSSDSSNQTGNNNTSGYIEGQAEPSEPTYIKGILIVNKKYPLPSTYNKGEDPVAKAALVNMLEAGKTAGFEYSAFSGFRSYEYQKNLYNRYVNRDGKANADRYSARPGHSEHQSGLAFDIGEKSRQDLWLTEEFGETPAGQWLMNNAHHYGFILRYPKGKEHITGFMYESWHYRYVGVELATAIYNAQTTLEEYLNIQ